MEVTKEFLDVVSLSGWITGKGIKEDMTKYVPDHQIDVKNLIGTATD